MLDTVVAVKLTNRHLSLALEGATGSGAYASPTYHWLHELSSQLPSAAGAAGDCSWRALVLLADPS